MKIVNYLDSARQKLFQTFLNCMKVEYDKEENCYHCEEFKNEQKAREIFEKLKSNSRLFNIYAQALYTSNFLYANFLANSSTCHAAKEDAEYYESYNSIDEFIENFEFDEFCEMFFEMCRYIDDGYYDKRQFIISLKEKLEFLVKCCPMFINDYIYYMNTYNTDEIMNNYYINMKDARSNPEDEPELRRKKERIAFKDSIMVNTDELIILSENDFDNYKYVICEMVEKVYRYLNYNLVSDKKLTKEENTLLMYIEKDLETLVILSLNNEIILGHLIRIFIKYNVLNENELENVNKYYDLDKEKKKLDNILKKTSKIKGEI